MKFIDRFLIFCTLILFPRISLAETALDVDKTLQEARDSAKSVPLSWKRFAIQVAGNLDSHDPKAVTEALYIRLKAEGADGIMRAMVSRISHTTKAFSPEIWLPQLASEQDPLIRVAAMQIFHMTQFANDARFQTILKNALNDTRVGRSLIGEERANSDEGLRVCDTAYNLLMSDRKDRPAEFPLDVSNDDVQRRNTLIMILCAQLDVPGPLSADAKTSLSETIYTASPQKGSVLRADAPHSHPSIKVSNFEAIAWAIGLAGAICLIWLTIKKRNRR